MNFQMEGNEERVKIIAQNVRVQFLKGQDGSTVCTVKAVELFTWAWWHTQGGADWEECLQLLCSQQRTLRHVPSFSPASLGEDNDGAGAALEGGLDGSNSDGLCGVTSQMGGATQLLEHLPVEHGCLSLTGNLNVWRNKCPLVRVREKPVLAAEVSLYVFIPETTLRHEAKYQRWPWCPVTDAVHCRSSHTHTHASWVIQWHRKSTMQITQRTSS